MNTTQENNKFFTAYFLNELKTSPRRCLLKNIYQIKKNNTIIGYVMEDLQDHLFTLSGLVEHDRFRKNITLEDFKQDINTYLIIIFDEAVSEPVEINKLSLMSIAKPKIQFDTIQPNNEIGIKKQALDILDNNEVFNYSNVPINIYESILSQLLSVLSKYTFTTITQNIKTTYYFTNTRTDWFHRMKEHIGNNSETRQLLNNKLPIEKAYEYSLSSQNHMRQRMNDYVAEIVYSLFNIIFPENVFLSTDKFYEKLSDKSTYDRIQINPYEPSKMKKVANNTFLVS